MREMTREALLALTPERYLANGYVGLSGQPRPELLTDDAMAAATQLGEAEVAPQELAYLAEALRQVLPLHEGSPHELIDEALEEALEAVGRMIRQDNNEGLVTWAKACAACVWRAADIEALLLHIDAVLRVYAVIVTLPPAGPPEPPPGSSPGGSSSLDGSPSGVA